MGDRLSNVLKAERERLGLTQGALAEAIGVSRKTINTIENGIFFGKQTDRSRFQYFPCMHKIRASLF
ncbi:MAG: helix-turn-helix domain-containing protein [Hymenobacter sp.]|nr:MAG: helix-turn-helix domain-containing protein [Hymenobacter sp.]